MCCSPEWLAGPAGWDSAIKKSNLGARVDSAPPSQRKRVLHQSRINNQLGAGCRTSRRALVGACDALSSAPEARRAARAGSGGLSPPVSRSRQHQGLAPRRPAICSNWPPSVRASSTGAAGAARAKVPRRGHVGRRGVGAAARARGHLFYYVKRCSQMLSFVNCCSESPILAHRPRAAPSCSGRSPAHEHSSQLRGLGRVAATEPVLRVGGAASTRASDRMSFAWRVDVAPTSPTFSRTSSANSPAPLVYAASAPARARLGRQRGRPGPLL